MTPPSTASSQEISHLRLLTIFHYVLAGLTALFACIPVVHLVLGIFMMRGQFGPPNEGPGPAVPATVGVIFVVVASILIVLGWVLAALLLFAGRCLARRKRLLFCQVVAGLSCVFFPFGTALGVFTLIVLTRPSVQALFDQP